MTITAIRTVIIYALLIVAMRIMGRRQLGELQPIELVVTLLISDMASIPMSESGTPLLSGIIPIAILVAAEILLSAWMLKSPRFASLISGTPLILIRDGKPDIRTLRKLRLTIDDLAESLRAQQVFDMADVRLAIAETNGSITVCQTAAKQPATVSDVRKPPRDRGMPLVILADGHPCRWAMEVCGITDAQLDALLHREGCRAEDVMMLTADFDGGYRLLRKEAGV